MSVITILQSELHLSNSSIQMYVWKEDILAGYSTVYKQYSYAFWFLSPFCLQNPYFSLSFHGSLEFAGKRRGEDDDYFVVIYINLNDFCLPFSSVVAEYIGGEVTLRHYDYKGAFKYMRN